jgi:DMSO/TMAO reductase YedYZ molybdopterin-dependent catalytic subunit
VAPVVDGDVRTPLKLSIAELKKMPRAEATCVLQCAGNGRALQSRSCPACSGATARSATRAGAACELRDVLARAGVGASAKHLHTFGSDDPPGKVPPFHRSLELAKAMDDCILAYEMNGQPLPQSHGAPLRLVVPGWAGDHWMKWLVRLTLAPRRARPQPQEHRRRLPRDKLVVITGLSGSGKSSLAFDTIYAEGQRRYVESLSAYARQFLEQMEKPDVDLIDGLSPAISIEQKTTGSNPRSTVGTVTEIYDYLRLLFANIGVPHCPNCGKRDRLAVARAHHRHGDALSAGRAHQRARADRPRPQGRVQEGARGAARARLHQGAHRRPVPLARRGHQARSPPQPHDRRRRRSLIVKPASSAADRVGRDRAQPRRRHRRHQHARRRRSAVLAAAGLRRLRRQHAGDDAARVLVQLAARRLPRLPGARRDATTSIRSASCPTNRSRCRRRDRAVGEGDRKEIRERLRLPERRRPRLPHARPRAGTLSGGESQRIRLASQIGSGLTGVLYVLDEPSIGLHQRDNARLLETLKRLRDLGNTVIVVEHDEDAIRTADYVLDIGPGAGDHGGQIVAQGTPDDIMRQSELAHRPIPHRRAAPIEIPSARRRTRRARIKVVNGARGNNLKNVTPRSRSALFTCVTGVSGGASRRWSTTRSTRRSRASSTAPATSPAPHDRIEGSSISTRSSTSTSRRSAARRARTRRPTPAPSRRSASWFAGLPERRRAATSPGRFSFNVKGGRCEACQGDGVIKIEMHFLPDVYVTCDVCKGKRYNRETLEVLFKGKSIADVLDMTVEEALRVLQGGAARSATSCDAAGRRPRLHPCSASRRRRCPAARRSASSSPRSCRKRATGRTLYILDEPTTGLHFDDVAQAARSAARWSTRATRWW